MALSTTTPDRENPFASAPPPPPAPGYTPSKTQSTIAPPPPPPPTAVAPPTAPPTVPPAGGGVRAFIAQGSPDVPGDSSNRQGPGGGPVTGRSGTTQTGKKGETKPTDKGGGGGESAPATPTAPAIPGAGPSSPGFAGLVKMTQPYNNAIWKFLQDAMSGKLSAYTPDTIQYMEAALKGATEGNAQSAMQAVDADAARRGIFSSGIDQPTIAGIQREKQDVYGKGVNQIYINKAQSDMQTRMQALHEASAWLNNLQSYLAKLDLTDAERQKLQAEIQLGYANLANQMNIAQVQSATSIQDTLINNSGAGMPPPPF